jgi:hypothetical protein
VAAIYSLPFPNNICGGVAPKQDATANLVNIQPVILICLPSPPPVSARFSRYQPMNASLQAFGYVVSPTYDR